MKSIEQNIHQINKKNIIFSISSGLFSLNVGKQNKREYWKKNNNKINLNIDLVSIDYDQNLIIEWPWNDPKDMKSVVIYCYDEYEWIFRFKVNITDSLVALAASNYNFVFTNISSTLEFRPRYLKKKWNRSVKGK